MTDLDLDDRDVNGPTLNDDLRQLRELNSHRKLLEKEAAEAVTEYKAWRDHCYERMEDEKVESTRHDGSLFTRNEPTWFATVQDKQVLIAWLKENQPAVVKEDTQQALLNKLVRACNQDGRPFPPGLSAYPQKTVSVKK